jgi:outer membrane protein assembly factor BamB
MLLLMRSVRRLFVLSRPWLLPLLLLPFFLTSLVSCAPCEAMSPPPITPTLWVSGGQVYLYSYGARMLYVLRESDGKPLWQASGTLEATATDQLYLIVDQYDSRTQDTHPFLEALQASSGTLLWRNQINYAIFVLGTSAHSVLLYDETQSGVSELVALDASTGAQRWTMPITTPFDSYSLSAQVDAGIVYLTSDTGSLSAYNEESGTLLWTHAFPSAFSAYTPWFVSHGAIYLSGDRLYALRASDGATLWQTDQASIALDPDHGILYTLDNHSLSALRAQDGQVLWRQIVVLDTSSVPLLQLIDGTLYTGLVSPFAIAPPRVLGSDFLNGVNAHQTSDGHSLWDDAVHKGNLVAVAGALGSAYLLSQPSTRLLQHPATLTARRVSDGTQLWQQRLAAASGLVYADGALYIGYGGDNETSGCIPTGLATVVKVRPTDGKQLWSFHA